MKALLQGSNLAARGTLAARLAERLAVYELAQLQAAVEVRATEDGGDAGR